MLKLAAFQWRELAKKAAERQKIQWPWVLERTGQELARESPVLAQRCAVRQVVTAGDVLPVFHTSAD
jgi:hypothetical protein